MNFLRHLSTVFLFVSFCFVPFFVSTLKKCYIVGVKKKKKKKERIKGEEKSEKKFNGPFDLVSPQNYSFARTFKLAIISPDYIQHDIQKNLKAS